MNAEERCCPDKSPYPGEIKLPTLLFLVSVSLVLGVAGCTPPPLLSYSTDMPGQILSALEAPDVRDGRARFREIFCAVLERHPHAETRPCADFLHRLSDEPGAEPGKRARLAHDPRIALLFVPGLFSDCAKRFGMPFETSAEKLHKLGYSTNIVAVSGRSSPTYNAPIIAAAVRKAIAQGREQVVLIGHSKGVVDSLEFLVAYPRLVPHVLAVASVAGAINGSPLGDTLSGLYEQWLLGIDANLCPAGDDGAVSSLRRSARLAWLHDHPLPENVSYYSLASFTRPENMHWPLRPFYHALEEIDPSNDGQLLYTDQVIPGGTLLGYANADHWSVAIPIEEKTGPISTFFIGNPVFPRDAMVESIVLYLLEDLDSQ